jgi:branched-chain amino acid transport system ATP-binding protein
MTAIVQLVDVSIAFGGVLAVDNVSLTVERGEVLGLIGPNGAGKTTLLNGVSGLNRLKRGRILLEGKIISSLPSYRIARAGIGRTFQIVQPFAHLSVLENVAIGAMFSNAGRGGTQHDAKEIALVSLERVGLTSKRDFLPSQLTLSERKRLELARALSTNPRVLLLDEVMAGINHTEIDVLIDLVRHIRDSGTTIVIIEHVMKAILALCDRIAVLQFGKLIAMDRPSVIMNDTNVVAAYLGSRFAKRQAQRNELVGA